LKQCAGGFKLAQRLLNWWLHSYMRVDFFRNQTVLDLVHVPVPACAHAATGPQVLHPSGNRGLETAHPRHPHGRSGDAGPPRGLGLGSHGRAR
jgi:hypothetical protein